MVAALIGAGGFGALMFRGLLSSALELVLLEVIPAIALALLVNTLFKVIILMLQEGAPVIEFQGVSKFFHCKPAVEDLSFTLPAGDITVLIGPFGSGKSTTLKMINRLI